MQAVIRDVTLSLNKFELGIACQILYDFTWSDFCDWYIELTKSALHSDDDEKKDNAVSVLLFVLENALRLLHPFVPFITDEIYRSLPNTTGSIMVADYPRYNSKLAYKKEAAAFGGVMEIIKALREVKVETGCAPSKKVNVYLLTDAKRLVSANADCIAKLGGAASVKCISTKEEAEEKSVAKVTGVGTLFVPLGELVDADKERERLNNELERIMGEIRRADGKLNNQGFIAKAPKQLVEAERAKLNTFAEMREKILEQLKNL